MKKDEIVLRQYEALIETTTQVTNWRQNANNFYLAVNTVILALAAFEYGSSPMTSQIAGVMGIAVSALWYQKIAYFRALNSAKFRVINEMEGKLPSQPFTKEHTYFSENKRKSATQLERWIPLIFGLAYLIAVMPALPRFLNIA